MLLLHKEVRSDRLKKYTTKHCLSKFVVLVKYSASSKTGKFCKQSNVFQTESNWYKEALQSKSKNKNNTLLIL